jgi:hypothetical protein
MTSYRSVRTAVLAVVVVSIASSVSCGNSTSQERLLPQMTNCPAKRFAPGYLPGGVHETKRPSVVPTREWYKTWTGKGTVVQVLGGISADHGDDPDITHPKVRGHSAEMAPVVLQSGTYLVVDWSENAECGSHEYAVATKGLSKKETLKIANSLKEPGTSSPNY